MKRLSYIIDGASPDVKMVSVSSVKKITMVGFLLFVVKNSESVKFPLTSSLNQFLGFIELQMSNETLNWEIQYDNNV